MNATQNNAEKDRFAPGKLLAIFTNTRIMNYLVMAVVIHVVVIGALSVNYLLDKAFPSRVADRERVEKERQDAEKKAEEDKRAAAAAARAPAATSNAPAAGTNVAQAAAAVIGAAAAAAMAGVDTNHPIIKETTEAAAPNELPKANDLGISINDTNPR